MIMTDSDKFVSYSKKKKEKLTKFSLQIVGTFRGFCVNSLTA